MADVFSMFSMVNGGSTRRGVLRVMAGAAVLTAGSAALTACGSAGNLPQKTIKVPGAYTGAGTTSVNASTASSPSSMFSMSSGVLTLVGSGTGLGGTTDNFNFYFGEHDGNGTFSARVVSQGTASGDGGKGMAGLMVRQSAADDAPFVTLYTTTGTSGSVFAWRATAGSAVSDWPIAYFVDVPLPVYLEIQMGKTSSGYQATVAYSTTGKAGSYTRQLSQPVSAAFFDGPYLIGVTAASAVSGTNVVDKFDSFSGFTPSEFISIPNATFQSSVQSGSKS